MKRMFIKMPSTIYIGLGLIKLVLLNIFVKPFMFAKPRYNKKYNVSICGIFKNEGRFLYEWLAYHEIIGIDHFFLYDNNSTDNYKEILQPWINKGVVTLIDWPYNQAQVQAYKHFYENYRHETQWVSFLDLDEFIVPRKEIKILDWIKRNDWCPVRLIYWKMFGTSGLMQHDDSKLVIEQYHISWERLYECGKCLINTDYDIANYNSSIIHATKVRYPLLGVIRIVLPPINQFGYFVNNKFHFKWLWRSDDVNIQINHYWSKAWDIYDAKRKKTDAFYEQNPKLEMRYFYAHENHNTASDYVIMRFLMQLKLSLNKDE